MEEIKKWNQFTNENYLKSDAIGYNISEYIYHVTPTKYMNNIKKNGFKPQNGTTIGGKKYEKRLYFATSLIAAYDISVNFESYREDNEYVIFIVNSDCLNGYEKDPLFVHGIYIDYPISNDYIINVIKANSLINQYDENDIENLY